MREILQSTWQSAVKTKFAHTKQIKLTLMAISRSSSLMMLNVL